MEVDRIMAYLPHGIHGIRKLGEEAFYVRFDSTEERDAALEEMTEKHDPDRTGLFASVAVDSSYDIGAHSIDFEEFKARFGM